jgi:isopentenyl-diphosphate delta-isomerase
MEKRKKDHISLAFSSQTENSIRDNRFIYEPLLSEHSVSLPTYNLLGKNLKAPLWISSITGGTGKAGKINRNLAKAAAEFGLGMGLGSCRCLLDDDACFDDFNVRDIIGNELPLYANLGIGQVEQLLETNAFDKIERVVDNLQADGLIIHVNPMQEFFQPEGDCFKNPPIDTIEKFLQKSKLKLIVKEVGQGMGAESLKRLMQLPLEAIEFAAFGGTNFSKLELLRSNDEFLQTLSGLMNTGHTADEMLENVNNLAGQENVKVRNIIISGGINSFLDGYYLINKSKLPAVYGQAAAFLKYAMLDYEKLRAYVKAQIEGLKMAYAYLKVK